MATYELVKVSLKHGVSLILEKAWFRGLSEAELRQSLPISRAVQVHVTANQPVAVRGPGTAADFEVSEPRGVRLVAQPSVMFFRLT